jgi:hypothetical protein
MIKRSVLAASLLLFLAAGCGGTSLSVDSPSSPLGNGGIDNTQCGPDPSGGIVTDGGTVLANHSKGTVTVEGVRYYGDRHLRLVHAVVLPIRGALVGVANGWPPPRRNLINAKARWSQAVPAVGARIPHHLPRFTQMNLVIAFKPMAHRSVADGIQVRYREGGQQYELRTHTRTVIVIARGVTNRECGPIN